MFSERVLDYSLKPRRCGELSDATHVGMEGIPGEGPFVLMRLKIQDGVILDGAYETYGCPASIASSTALIELVCGLNVEIARSISAEQIEAYLGGLPEGKHHCMHTAIKAFHFALENPICH